MRLRVGLFEVEVSKRVSCENLVKKQAHISTPSITLNYLYGCVYIIQNLTLLGKYNTDTLLSKLYVV